MCAVMRTQAGGSREAGRQTEDLRAKGTEAGISPGSGRHTPTCQRVTALQAKVVILGRPHPACLM